MVDAAWQLENVLEGAYVDSTRLDAPGRRETDAYTYTVTDISVAPHEGLVTRVLDRLGAKMPYRVETTVRFRDAAPDPDAVADHRYMPGEDLAVGRDGDTLTVEQDIVTRRQYDTRFAQFRETVDDLLGGADGA